MATYWRILQNGRPLFRPAMAANVHDARRRVLASLGLELEGISEAEYNAQELRSLATGGLPGISEACEPGERMDGGSPCFGKGDAECPLKVKCANWLHRARGLEVQP